MAIYRKIQMSFWTDPKVIDDFTPEDKYFYLYLMTNPHTNLAGCYEMSMKQMSDETGYTKETIEKLISRMSDIHKVIAYDNNTKEIIIINWYKYNWTSSEDFRKPLFKEIENVKNSEFRRFLTDLFNGVETVIRPSQESPETTVTVTDTASVSDTVINISNKINNRTKGAKLNLAAECGLVDEAEISPALKDTLKEWLEYKRDIKDFYVEKSILKMIEEFDDMSRKFGIQYVISSVNYTISRGYKGIVWQKEPINKIEQSSVLDRLNSMRDAE